MGSWMGLGVGRVPAVCEAGRPIESKRFNVGPKPELPGVLMTRALAIACLLPLVGIVHAQSTPSSDALAARIKAMAQIPITFNAVYSHDGKRIAFLSNRSGTPQVWLVDTAGGEPKQITQEADPVGSLAWSPVDDTIAYDVARGGGFNAQ